MNNPTCTYRTIFRLWYPLTLTWFMMSLEGPLLAALIARLAEPKYNLAAYGIAYSLAMLVESPIIMLMSASNALVKGKESLAIFSRFATALNGLITCIMILLVIPKVYLFITHTIMGLPLEICWLAHGAQVYMIPWPAAIGIRRFYQGLMVAQNQAHRVTYGTIVRMSSMACVGFLFYSLHILPGAQVGGLALTVGVVCEAIASRYMVRKILLTIRSHSDSPSSQPLRYRALFSFYLPLAMTSILSLGIQPLVTFFVGSSKFNIESLAVMPVILSCILFFRSFGIAYLEVVVSLLGQNSNNYRIIRRFGYGISVMSMVLYGSVVLTPLSFYFYHTIAGLSEELALFALIPAQILVIAPFLEPLVSLKRGVLIVSKSTVHSTTATAIELGSIVILLSIFTRIFDVVGAVAAVSGIILSRLASLSYLVVSSKASLKKHTTLSNTQKIEHASLEQGEELFP